ncbi:antitoxin VapB family protein [Halorientalis regularis]|jgi:predicted CopG family antitoxin|uniref:Uncharacterized ACR, COG1753 n=1 Tax=Halorientalis regularis TaxID=660518 RepID=A0A1G7HKY7_9EURY|nr:antitoxin VapB family protein [Halorientalis regularis]SDF01132.1 Uncharacterized ACR, COG1753 [Halorientalis regularis]
MGSANEHIRVSSSVKERLDSLRGDDESYNDVLERLVEKQSEKDFETGFGILSGSDTSGHVEAVREAMDEQMADRLDAVTDSDRA